MKIPPTCYGECTMPFLRLHTTQNLIVEKNQKCYEYTMKKNIMA